jgi:diguanylate cyclase (GGDEF)-like protein
MGNPIRVTRFRPRLPMNLTFPALFALDVRTVLVLLFAGNAALGGLIFLYEWFTEESRHRRPLRIYALARLIQALAWLLMLERGQLPDLLSTQLGNSLLLGGFYLESLITMDLAKIRRPRARGVHTALSLAGLCLLNVVSFAYDSPSNRMAAGSLGLGLCVALPSVLFILDAGGSTFRRMLGIGNLVFVGVLVTRAIQAMGDKTLHLYSHGATQGFTFLLLILIMVLSGTVILLIAKEEADRELMEMATRDSLTGLSNRRAFLAQATQVLAYHQRYGLEATVLFIDIDHFKAVNDRHGHAAGDQVIQHLAQVLRQTIREFDLPRRYGGEEFVLLLPNSSRTEGLHVGERIREEVARAGKDQVPEPYTVSVGLASTRGPAKDPLRDLLARSDAALYRAKQGGRNRVEVDEPPGHFLPGNAPA